MDFTDFTDFMDFIDFMAFKDFMDYFSPNKDDQRYLYFKKMFILDVRVNQ